MSYQSIKRLAVALILLSASPVYAATTIPFTITTSESVNVTGTPRIQIDVGGVTRYAAYTSGTGTSSLTFTYTMVAGDVDLDGVTLTSPMQLNGGTIKDLNGNDATLTFTVPNTSNVKVNYPSLGMDFVADADGRYTLNGNVYNDLTSFLTATGGSFTRASVGTYYDASGTLQTAASGTPRFDYDPVTHTAKGLLIEESRTNYARFPAIGVDWRAPWSNANHTCLSTDSTVTTPDGRFASLYTCTTTSVDGTNSGRNFSGNIARTVGQKAVLDVYLGGAGSITTGSIGIISSVTTWGANSDTSYSIVSGPGSLSSQFGGIFYFTGLSTTQLTHIRLIRTATTTENLSSIWYSKDSGSMQVGTLSGMLGMPQFEAGDFATSYIPTTATAVTRQADNLTIPVGGWFNSSAGTQSAIFYAPSIVSGVNRVLGYTPGSGCPICFTGSKQIWWDGSALATSNSLTANVINKVASGYTSSLKTTVLNGGTVISGALGGTPISSATNFYIGSETASTNYLNGQISVLKYYPSAVTGTQLQLMTQ